MIYLVFLVTNRLEVKEMVMKLLLLAVFLLSNQAIQADEMTHSRLIIDDFTDSYGRSTLGGYWQLSSDRVMGGVSNGRAVLVPSEDDENRFVLKMTGEVRLENNGGFVQVRLPLSVQNRQFDATEYNGISLRVRGNGQKYYVHLRTAASRLPWLYHYSGFEAPEEWTDIKIPFDSFISDTAFLGDLPRDRLVSIAVVAAKQRMAADIEVAEISMYK